MPSDDSDYYNIDTAGYYRKSKWKDSEEVIADLSEPGQSAAAADASKPQVPGENGGELINAEAQVPSSEGKDTKNINTLQEFSVGQGKICIRTDCIFTRLLRERT